MWGLLCFQKAFLIQMQIEDSKVEETKQEWLRGNLVEELKEEGLDLHRVCRQMNGHDINSKKQESFHGPKDPCECDSLKKELDKLRRTMGRGKRRMRNAVGRQATFNMRSRGSFKKASELAMLFQLQMQIHENKVEETKQERLHVNRVEELKEEVLDLNLVRCLQELKDSYEGGQDQSRSRTRDSLKKELDMLRRTALQVMGGIDQIEQKVYSIFEQRQIHVREFESPLLECEHVEAQYVETTTALATQQMKSGDTDENDGGQDTSLLFGND